MSMSIYPKQLEHLPEKHSDVICTVGASSFIVYWVVNHSYCWRCIMVNIFTERSCKTELW